MTFFLHWVRTEYEFHLEEEQKNRLSDGSSQLRVLQRIFDLRLPEENVSAASPPQHFLESRKTLAADDAGHEAECIKQCYQIDKLCSMVK